MGGGGWGPEEVHNELAEDGGRIVGGKGQKKGVNMVEKHRRGSTRGSCP